MPPKPHSNADARKLRRRAEQRLQASHAEPGRARIEADAQRLVHELQVHQVELEMQNAELVEARERMEVLLEKYTELYDFAPVGYFSVAANGTILLVNLAGARVLGVERSRLLGRSLEQYVAAKHRIVLRAFLKRTMAGGHRQSCAVTLASSSRPRRTVSIEAERSPDLPECRAVMTDITERKEAEATERRATALATANQEARREIARRRVTEAALRKNEKIQRGLVAESRELHAQLRRLTRQILLAQEEERKAISRELHDEVAQTLAGINVHLAVLNESPSLDRRSLRRRVAQTQRLVERSVKIVHRYARKLRPVMLDDLGLIPALRSYIKDMPGGRRMRVNFTADTGVEALDSARRTVLFRVAQEALTNVARHAHAQLATVRVRRMGDTVRLEVHDDGKSFAAARLLASKASKRLGLLGMRERVDMVGGTLAIKSAPGKGTTVRAEIPLRGTRRPPKP
jgi:PAS domain S-box-containing protein